MIFGIIEAFKRNVALVDYPDIRDAQKAMIFGEVDHGVVSKGLGIVVYEYGLFTPPEQQAYFSIARRLYAGNAVLYGFNDGGGSVDLLALPQVLFMTATGAKRNIALGLLECPTLAVNGAVIWRWPEPPKPGMMP